MSLYLAHFIYLVLATIFSVSSIWKTHPLICPAETKEVSVQTGIPTGLCLVLPPSLQLMLAIVLILPIEMDQIILPKSCGQYSFVGLGAFETLLENSKIKGFSKV